MLLPSCTKPPICDDAYFSHQRDISQQQALAEAAKQQLSKFAGGVSSIQRVRKLQVSKKILGTWYGVWLAPQFVRSA